MSGWCKNGWCMNGCVRVGRARKRVGGVKVVV